MIENINNERTQLECSEETFKTIHKWRVHFQLVYKREFSYEDILHRALECLQYGELEVYSSIKRWELEDTNRHKYVLRNKKE